MPRRHWLLNGPSAPTHADNRMRYEGEVASARKRYLEHRFRNLEVLLRQRYEWMNGWLSPDDNIIELGCGAGFSRLFVDHDRLKLTDFVVHDWVDQKVDAMDLPYDENSVDVFICSHMIHHMASPMTFFANVYPILRENGRIVIQEINTGLLMRALLQMMKHEGWSYDIDVFDPNAITNDPADPWSANCAIPEMLWGEGSDFERRVPGFKVVLNEVNEAFLFPLSRGVIAQSSLPIPELPYSVLSVVQSIDKMLVSAMPGTFATGRSVVLQKRPLDA